jgi:TrmH family RNA methyltransferase
MVTRARIARYRSLSRPKARREEGLYLIEGRRLVGEAVRSGAPVAEVLVTARFEGDHADLVREAAGIGAEVVRVPERELARIADVKTPQGVAAVIRRASAPPAVPEGDGLFLFLDGVSDPGNAGTLVRAADAFGAAAVIGAGETADFENPKVLRAAMGSTFHLPVLRLDDLEGALAGFRRGGGRVAAATLDGEDLYEYRPRAKRLAVVLGSEAHGVSERIRALADDRVTVPSPGRAESLNVAMAGAIVLSWLARGRSEAE